MDDKGLVVVVGFGLQPLVVTCPAACACLAALQMQQSKFVSDRGVLRIGIGTGPVFCAAIGSDFRREFALVGKVVNLAARLAFFSLKTTSEGDTNPYHSICVDEETEKSASGRIEFVTNDIAKQLRLKGISGGEDERTHKVAEESDEE